MAPNYGHSNAGVNITNHRIISEKQGKPGYRTPFDWAQESANHVGLGQSQRVMSTSLRQSTTAFRTAAAEQVATDISTVEAALKNKLRQTDSLRNALSSTIQATIAEIEQCVLLKASLEQRGHRVVEKADLNESRLQVRSRRPAREKTMDDVEGLLLQQQGMIGTFTERVHRAIGHLDREVQQLDMMRLRLEADLRDKIDAMDVDRKVLAVQPDGTPGEAASLRRRNEASTRTPTAWASSTEENIRSATKWIADSVRLRKAIRHAVLGARTAEHEMARSLNNQMLGKIADTTRLRSHLEQQLAKLQEERVSAQMQRASLVQALEAKRGPLQQAKERLQARKARPDREQVQDEVETALVTEIAHLNAITLQLSSKINVVDKTLANLDVTAATIEDNIRDKDTTLSMDERVALLDGRINLTSAPPSSIFSHSAASSSSEVRDATMRRINELEVELQVARKERHALETNIASLRSTLASPRSTLAPLSP